MKATLKNLILAALFAAMASPSVGIQHSRGPGSLLSLSTCD